MRIMINSIRVLHSPFQIPTKLFSSPFHFQNAPTLRWKCMLYSNNRSAVLVSVSQSAATLLACGLQLSSKWNNHDGGTVWCCLFSEPVLFHSLFSSDTHGPFLFSRSFLLQRTHFLRFSLTVSLPHARNSSYYKTVPFDSTTFSRSLSPVIKLTQAARISFLPRKWSRLFTFTTTSLSPP